MSGPVPPADIAASAIGPQVPNQVAGSWDNTTWSTAAPWNQHAHYMCWNCSNAAVLAYHWNDSAGSLNGLTQLAVVNSLVGATNTDRPGAQPPTGLTVGTVTTSTVSLSWSVPPGGALSYNLYRDGTKVQSGITATSTTDTGLGGGTAHTYTVTAVNAISEGQPSNAVQATTQSAPGQIKWNPGHYMDFNTYLNGTGNLSTIVAEMDGLNNFDRILGYQAAIYWGALETAQGDYSAGISLISSLLNTLKTKYNKPKRLAVIVAIGNPTKTNPNGSFGVIPQYIQSAPATYGSAGYRVGGVLTNTSFGGWWGGDGNGNTYGACIHRPAVADRIARVFEAILAAFDSEPYFEGIMLDENSFIWGASGSNGCPDFSTSAFINGYNTIIGRAKVAGPHTNVAYQNTFAGTPTPTQQIMDWIYQNKVMECPTDSGGAQYVQAHNNTPISWGMAAYRGVVASGSTWTPTDYAPLTRAWAQVQGPDLGAYKGEPYHAKSAADMLTSLNLYSKVSHAFWCNLPNSTQAANADGIVITWSTLAPFLNNPANALTNTAYPQNYP